MLLQQCACATFINKKHEGKPAHKELFGKLRGAVKPSYSTSYGFTFSNDQITVVSVCLYIIAIS